MLASSNVHIYLLSSQSQKHLVEFQENLHFEILRLFFGNVFHLLVKLRHEYQARFIHRPINQFTDSLYKCSSEANKTLTKSKAKNLPYIFASKTLSQWVLRA